MYIQLDLSTELTKGVREPSGHADGIPQPDEMHTLGRSCNLGCNGSAVQGLRVRPMTALGWGSPVHSCLTFAVADGVTTSQDLFPQQVIVLYIGTRVCGNYHMLQTATASAYPLLLCLSRAVCTCSVYSVGTRHDISQRWSFVGLHEATGGSESSTYILT